MGITPENRVVLITGGANGIGAALAAQCRAKGARVAVLDRVVCEKSQMSLICDVGDANALRNAVEQVQEALGPIDICVSNAGILSNGDQPLGTAEDWERCWRVNVMAHVNMAQAVLPDMVARGSGWFVNVASAAGLLNQIGDAAYSATKHAAVSFAESLAITHGADGIGVSVVCPQYVATGLIGLSDDDASQSEALLTADDVADHILAALAEGTFRVLPHPDVARFAQMRAEDHDAWIRGMQRLRQRAVDEFGQAAPGAIYKLL